MSTDLAQGLGTALGGLFTVGFGSIAFLVAFIAAEVYIWYRLTRLAVRKGVTEALIQTGAAVGPRIDPGQSVQSATPFKPYRG